jgi:hypothetical protein
LTNVRGFEADLKKFAALTGIRLAQVRDKAGIDVARKTISRTPVLTGRLASSWRLSYNAPDLSVAEENPGPPDKNPSVSNPNPFMVLFFTNAMPYAARIEYEQWSKKAPAGMLELSIVEVHREMVAAIS